MTGYVIAAAVLIVDGLLFNAFALGGDRQAVGRGAEPLLLLLERHDDHRQRLHLDAPAGRGAPDRHAGAAHSSPVQRLGDRRSASSSRRSSSWRSSRWPTVYMPAAHLRERQDLARAHGGRLPGPPAARQRRRWRIGTFGSALARTQVLAAIFSGCIVVALIVCWLLGQGDRAAAQRRLRRRWRCTASTSRRFSRARPPARRRLLPDGHLRGAVRARPGCWRAGGGDDGRTAAGPLRRRWSALWGAGMLAIFVGERMIGAGGARAVATVGRPRCWWSPRWSCAPARAARAAPDRAAGRADAARALRARPLRGRALLRAVGSADRARQGQAARARLAAAGDGARPRSGRRSGWRRPGRSRSSRWPTRRSRARPASRSAASATRCTPGSAWRRRWCSPSRSPTSPPSATRRSTWPTSAPPGRARSTRRIVRNLDQPIEVAVFFPAGNEVREEVDNYLARPGAASRASSRSRTTTSTSIRSRPRSSASPATA